MFKKIRAMHYRKMYGNQVARAYEIFGGRIVSITKSDSKKTTKIDFTTELGNELQLIEETE